MSKLVPVWAAMALAFFAVGCGSSQSGVPTATPPTVFAMPSVKAGYALQLAPSVYPRAMPVVRETLGGPFRLSRGEGVARLGVLPALTQAPPGWARRASVRGRRPHGTDRSARPPRPRQSPLRPDIATVGRSGQVALSRRPGATVMAGLSSLTPFASEQTLVPRPVRPEVRHEIAALRPGSHVALRLRPGGTVMAVLSSSTPFGSRQTLGVLARRPGWLKVNAAVLPDGHSGWVRAAQVRTTRTRWAVRISRSRRRLTVFDGGRAVRSFLVGVGSASSPTPLGRFSVTDELPGPRYSPVYGCCILALSGTQAHLPAGYPGGDRLAIHGTTVSSSIGGTDSLGCVYTWDSELRYLTRRLPLGTPVRIVR